MLYQCSMYYPQYLYSKNETETFKIQCSIGLKYMK